MTVVLITHYMEEAVLADRVLVVQDGSILMDDTPQAVFTQPAALQKVGLDVPQATELLQALADMGLPVSVNAIDEASCVDEIMKLFSE
jgi:energy-coupling factor transport system ATP-binding protein